MAIHDENQTQPSSGLGLASLMTGIASIVVCGLGIILGPVAVVLGIVSGRRGSFGGKEIAGILTGAIGFVVWGIAVAGVVLFSLASDDSSADDLSAILATSTESAQPDPIPSVEAMTVLTETGIADSRFDTAYAAYDDAYGTNGSPEGIYSGEDIDTPCFTMDGEPWWITQGSPETCEPSSELWWETSADGTEPEITLFGSGGEGAAISFEALSTEVLMNKFGTTDLATVAGYARDTLLPDSGATDIVETPIELGGLPAVQLDCSIEGLAAYRLDVVMLPEPHVLDDGTEITGFIIHAYNEAEWVYRTEDVFSRLDGSLTWK